MTYSVLQPKAAEGPFSLRSTANRVSGANSGTDTDVDVSPVHTFPSPSATRSTFSDLLGSDSVTTPSLSPTPSLLSERWECGSADHACLVVITLSAESSNVAMGCCVHV